MKAENKTVIELKVDTPAYGAVSIGRWKGKIVFIKNAIPGETVEAVLEEEKRDYYMASAVKILDASPDRIEPTCKYFGLCGGCQLQYITYDRQVRLKEEVLTNCIKRLAKTEINISEPLLYDKYWNYRYRGQFKVSQGKTGFYREKTRDVVDIDDCPLMTPEIKEYFLKAKRLITDFGIKEIHISYGSYATAFIKASTYHSYLNKGKVGGAASLDKLAKMLMDSGFCGIVIDSGTKIFKYGSPYITLDLEGMRYTISPMSFFQSHWKLNQRVVRFIKERLQHLNGKKVLDLYSGAGNFSLPVAKDADEIIAVEENPYAIEDGKRNLKINGIKNYRFIHSSIEALQIKDKVDILIVDPPRLGLTNAATEKILAMMPERIAYVSCNPATLARDLRKLLVKYSIESIRLIDFFPQTYHIESLVFLRLK